MKGTGITVIVVAILIGVGFLGSLAVYNDINDKLADAYAEGFIEGQEQAYTASLQDGGTKGYQEGSRTGYHQSGISPEFDGGYDEGYYFAYNPTYEQIPEILNEVSENTTKGIHDYAEANGIRVAYVRCQLARPAPEGMVYIKQLVAFETVDKGLVIIEPSTGNEVVVEVGYSYTQLNGQTPKPYDDTITKMSIVW
jgi:hypothetical protein